MQVLLDEQCESREIDVQAERLERVELERALRDAGREIADALEIDDELQGHGQEAQVGRDRLARREDLERELVDVVLVAIDAVVLLDHAAREVVVVVGERLHRERDLLLAAAAHAAQPLAQRAQLGLEFLARVRGHDAPLGNRNQKMLPVGAFGSTPTSPLMLSTRCLTIERPRPVPPVSRERLGFDAVEPLEHALAVLRGDAGAVVAHLDADALAVGARPTQTCPSSREYFTALSMRFTRIRSSALGSARTTSASGIARSSATRRAAARLHRGSDCSTTPRIGRSRAPCGTARHRSATGRGDPRRAREALGVAVQPVDDFAASPGRPSHRRSASRRSRGSP